MKFDESSKTLTITSYEDFDKNEDYVSEVEKYASKAKKVVIGNGITELPDDAFSCFKELTEVKLNNVKEIGMYAFNNCFKLEKIDLSKVESFEQYSFSDCRSLKTIDLKNAKFLMDHAFSYCTKLNKILNTNKIERIYGNIVSGCTSLVEFCMPSEVEISGMGEPLFKGCTKLKTVKFLGAMFERKRKGYEEMFRKATGHQVDVIICK